MDLEQCIKLLKNAKTDNEMMAALMLVAKLVNSSGIGGDGRKKVFDAVGFSFINRLLATDKRPEGCTENPYQKIAVTILACFCTDHDLVLHPQITSKIPMFNSFILEQRPTDVQDGYTVATESLQCLQALSSSDVGVLHLLRHKTPESLAKVIVMQTPAIELDAAKGLLLYILGRENVQSATSYLTTVLTIIRLLANEFNIRQDELKFQLCETLYSVLSLSGDSLVESIDSGSTDSVGWLRDIASGLQDILTSRVDPVRRNRALQLAAVLTHLLGVCWAVQTNVKFFMIMVNLVSVELRMVTEDQELSQIVENSNLICSYFIILENSVIFITQQSDLAEANSDKGSLLCQGELTQLHTTLTEAFSCVIHILQKLKEHSNEAGHTENLKTLTTAAVRVLGAWLAEETLSLSSDVYHLLPFLIELCHHHLKEGEDGDQLKFLLPGLSHLSAEDKPRKILLKAGLQKLLVAYIQQLLPCYQTSSDLCGRLALCCEVMMNVCITESEAVKDDQTFTSIAVHALQIVKDGCSRLNLSAALLSLLIIRRQGFERLATQMKTSELTLACYTILRLLLHTVKLCPQVSRVLKPAVLSKSSSQSTTIDTDNYHWSDVSELWFLAMQELTALITFSREFGDILLQASSQGLVLQEFTDILRVFVQLQKEDEESQSISTAIGSLLPSLTVSSHEHSC